MSAADQLPGASKAPCRLVEPGYWTIAELAEYLRCSRWTVARRVKSDPSFPVLHGYGAPRFPIDRVKLYLQRLEQGRGRAYKSGILLHSVPQVPVATHNGADPVQR